MKKNIPIESEFIRHLTKLVSSIIGQRDEVGPNGKVVRKLDYIETPKDEYAITIFKVAINIINTYEQLEFIPIFIRRFPISKYYKENGINQPKYLQYHIENHFLKISTIFDQCVILVCEVYRLGVNPKIATLNFLKENKFTNKSKAVHELKQFDKTIRKIKTIRNLISHRGEFSDEEIDNIAKYYFLYDETKNDEKPIFPEYILKFYMKEIIKSKKQLLEIDNNNTKKAILHLFHTSFEEFKKQYNKLG